jgi:hypothetical protein
MKRIKGFRNPFYLDLTDYGEWMICQGLYPNIIKYKVGGDKDMALKLVNDKIAHPANDNELRELYSAIQGLTSLLHKSKVGMSEIPNNHKKE